MEIKVKMWTLCLLSKWHPFKMHFNAIARCENFVQAKKSRFFVEEEEAAAAAEQAVKAIVEYTDKAHGEWKACEEKTCKNYSNNTAAAGEKVCLEKKLKTHEHIHTHTQAYK